MLAYLRLFRLSMIFTVVADTTVGFLFVQGSLSPVGGLVTLLAASCLLYTAGMILNDVFDLKVDRVERPERPLPSGDVPLGIAKVLGFGFLAVGFLLALAAGMLFGASDFPYRTGIWAICLVAAIVGYDAGLKRTVVGPIAMGSCRTFNFLMAMSLGESDHWWDVSRPGCWSIAIGIGVFVAGITWFARTEARASARGQLIFGFVAMLIGLIILGSLSQVDTEFAAGMSPDQLWFWPGLLVLVGVTIGRRCVMAIADPTPKLVQTAVKQSLLSLIVFDACILLFAFPSQPYYSIFTLTLLAPTLWLGRWIRQT